MHHYLCIMLWGFILACSLHDDKDLIKNSVSFKILEMPQNVIVRNCIVEISSFWSTTKMFHITKTCNEISIPRLFWHSFLVIQFYLSVCLHVLLLYVQSCFWFLQKTEAEMFGNEHHSPAMEEFLNLLGDRVKLKGFNRWVMPADCTTH